MLRPSCKNTLFFTLLHQQVCTYSATSVATEWNRPIGKKQSVQVIYCRFRTKDPWWWTRRYVGPEDTLSKTHSARVLRNAPRILASLPWARYRPAIRRRLVSDVRAKTKAALNLDILLRSPRTIACFVITRIDLVATSIYIEEAMPRGGRRREKSASVRAE